MFHAPTRVVFGRNTVQQVGEEALRLGATTVLVVTDPGVVQASLLEPVLASLTASGIAAEVFNAVEPNPSTHTVETAAAAYRTAGCDALLAVGGGSPMDAAKAVGILVSNGGALQEYEGKPEAIVNDPPPLLCVPTTCGSGSEVTPFAVVTDEARRFKMSIASPKIIPRSAIVDSSLLVSMPASLIAATGMDALTHAIESYTNRLAQPFSDALDLQAIRLIGRSLRVAVEEGSPDALGDLAVAATMAGMAFAQNRLGIVHAISHPVTAHSGTPHGVANAILLPYVMAFNAPYCADRLRDIAQALEWETSPSRPSPEDAVELVRQLAFDVGIPATLADAGVREEQVEIIAADAMRSGNVPINPRSVDQQEIIQVIRSALDGARS
jgi:alcohol dehydrogenase